MPYIQFWIDPNTGATFPQSYVRVLSAEARPVDSHVGLSVGRYASVTCFSLGFQPLERRDISLQGPQYATNFGPQIGAAQASFNGMLAQTADSYIGSTLTLSGATPTP